MGFNPAARILHHHLQLPLADISAQPQHELRRDMGVGIVDGFHGIESVIDDIGQHLFPLRSGHLQPGNFRGPVFLHPDA